VFWRRFAEARCFRCRWPPCVCCLNANTALRSRWLRQYTETDAGATARKLPYARPGNLDDPAPATPLLNAMAQSEPNHVCAQPSLQLREPHRPHTTAALLAPGNGSNDFAETLLEFFFLERVCGKPLLPLPFASLRVLAS